MSIIIVGGGMTGTILAIAISRMTHGQLPVHLIEAVPPGVSNHPSFDTRTIALAQGTFQQLARIGIKQALEDCVTTISTVHISERGHASFFILKAEDYCLDALGQVIELHDAGVRLFQILKESPGIILHCPAKVVGFTRTKDLVNVTLDNGALLTGKLLVAADGSQSSIGTACGIARCHQSYGQVAAIANVLTSIAHRGCAFERFTEYGSLAMLPMSQGRSSLIWCHTFKKIDEVITWPDDRFCSELQKVFGWRLGRIIHVGKRSIYPLTLTIASQFISHRTVLVGNAAQTLHPIAGQGFNLGLRDVLSLAEILTQAWIKQKEYGTWPTLCQYQACRKADKEATINLTDFLVKLFTNHWIPLVISRNVGLLVMKFFIPVRNILVRRILGLSKSK